MAARYEASGNPCLVCGRRVPSPMLYCRAHSPEGHYTQYDKGLYDQPAKTPTSRDNGSDQEYQSS